MPLASVYTAVFTKPFIAALIAMPIYGERIGIHRTCKNEVVTVMHDRDQSAEIANTDLSVLRVVARDQT